MIANIAQSFVGLQTAELTDPETQIGQELINVGYLRWADADEPTFAAGPRLLANNNPEPITDQTREALVKVLTWVNGPTGPAVNSEGLEAIRVCREALTTAMIRNVTKKVPGRVVVPVRSLEFEPGKDTLYVNNEQGVTVLRIKSRDGIRTHKLDVAPASHCDIYLEPSVVVHLAPDAISG